ncbi:hypothetical protein IKI14_02565 [bacterium]|nr:hypothetical protein [bacterium]
MTQRQVREMINNMKKSTIVIKKSNQYHKKEEMEADDILKKINIDDK